MKNSKQHLRASQLQDNLELTTDIVVIGSGAGGGIAAETLTNAGFKVVIIEKGPYHDRNDFNMNEAEAYLYRYHEVASATTRDKAIQLLQGKCVGGSTTVNWMSSFRTPEQTLKYWRDSFSVKGLGNNDLNLYFDRIEKKLNIKPWQGPHNQNNLLLQKGTNKLGWHNGLIRRNQIDCASIGACGLGCPIGAKQSMMETAIPKALQDGALLISELEAWRFEHHNGRIKTLQSKALNSELTDHSGVSVTIHASHFILAAGAIASPGLMLRSELPDPHQRIGKRTYCHPTIASTALYKQPVEMYKGAPQTIYSDHFLWGDDVNSEAYGFKIEVPPVHPILMATTLKHFGSDHARLMKLYPNLHVQIALLRDGFHASDEGGTVRLNAFKQPKLDYPISDSLIQSAFKALKSMATIQFASGAQWVMPMHTQAIRQNSLSSFTSHLEHLDAEKKKLQLFSAHLMGGCGMGEDPKRSVVNSQGKHHHIANLHVMDGSIFPSSLGVNPQVTVFSLSLRNSEALTQQIKLQTTAKS